MKRHILVIVLLCGVLPGMLSAGEPAEGPDAIICNIQQLMKWGSADGIVAYSFGSSKANRGTEDLEWFQTTNRHPVTFDNLYRLWNGRMEQIGMKWGMHGFCALQIPSGCAEDCPDAGGCLPMLLPGCESHNSASSSGSGNLLGPHWQINPWTAGFTIPYAQGDPREPTVLSKRLQVHHADIDPALYPGALYFAESMIVHPGDAESFNHYNNASYRPISISAPPNYNISFVTGEPTRPMRPALEAWRDLDPDVHTSMVDVPQEGRFALYYQVSNNGDGTWHYEYALLNVNSHRAARSFAVPFPEGVALSGFDFHDVSYHSGDGLDGVDFDGTDWVVSQDAGEIEWSTQSHDEDPNANALRFSTTYNFRFDADAAPRVAQVSIGLFRTGVPAAVTIESLAPGPLCPADLNDDGAVDAPDLAMLLGSWGPNPAAPADLNDDGAVNAADLALLLGSWGACP